MVKSIFISWLIFSIFFLNNELYANSKRDSIEAFIKIAPDDSTKVKKYRSLFFEYEFEDQEKAEFYAKESIKLATKISYINGIGYGYTLLGYLAEDKGLINEALNFHQKALQHFKSDTIDTETGMAYRNISSVYTLLGKYPKSLENALLSLKISEKNKNNASISSDYINLGAIYSGMNEYQKALDYFLKSLAIHKQSPKQSKIEIDYNNIGVALKELKQYEKAILYFEKAIKAGEQNKNIRLLLSTNVNIGGMYDELKNHKKAIEYFEKAIQYAEIQEDKNTLVIAYANMGSSFLFLKNYPASLQNLLKAQEMAEEISSLPLLKISNEFLSDYYYETKNFKKALFHYNIYADLKDSIFNIEKHEDITRQEMNYEFNKKESELKALQDKKNLLAAEEKKQNRMMIWFLTFILVIVFSVVFLILKTLKATKSQKKIIEKQKELVEEKQKEILDSIRYARKIQDAILTSQNYLRNNISRLKMN